MIQQFRRSFCLSCLNTLEWPPPPGIYFLVHRGKVVYVGRGVYYKRIVDHWNVYVFDSIYFIKMPPEIVPYMGKFYIRTFDPKYNDPIMYRNMRDRAIDEEVSIILRCENITNRIPQSVADRISALIELVTRDPDEVIDRFSNDVMTWDNR